MENLSDWLPFWSSIIVVIIGGWFTMRKLNREMEARREELIAVTGGKSVQALIDGLQKQVTSLSEENRRLRNEVRALRDDYERQIRELRADYESQINELVRENRQLRERIRHLERGELAGRKGFGR